MKAKDYIESRLRELSSMHKNIGIRYEYNPFYEAHLIELDLTKIVSKKDKKSIQKFQDIVSDGYYEKYFEDGICFFEKGDLILSISNPTYSYISDSENSVFIQLAGINNSALSMFTRERICMPTYIPITVKDIVVISNQDNFITNNKNDNYSLAA